MLLTLVYGMKICSRLHPQAQQELPTTLDLPMKYTSVSIVHFSTLAYHLLMPHKHCTITISLQGFQESLPLNERTHQTVTHKDRHPACGFSRCVRIGSNRD